MKFGYARVSTQTQSLDLQIDALVQRGVEEIFKDKASGIKKRPELERLLNYVRKGDVIIIWKLDRLGRSVVDLIKIVNFLRDKGVELISIQDNLDTTTAGGKLIFHMMAALAEFERDMISQRTKVGLEAARARGRKGGRPKGRSEKLKRIAPVVVATYESGRLSNKEISEQFGISVGSIYNCISYMKELEKEKSDK